MKKTSNLMKVKALAFISMGVVPFVGFSVGSDSEGEPARVEQVDMTGTDFSECSITDQSDVDMRGIDFSGCSINHESDKSMGELALQEAKEISMIVGTILAVAGVEQAIEYLSKL